MSIANDSPNPADEYFDVVDAADEVIDRQPRSLVHARGLRHRAAHILVFEPHGSLFVQRRALTKECSPGRWDSSAAGHVASGETYAVAARRELEEELGIVPDRELAPLFKIDASEATGHEFVWVYRTMTDQVLRPDPVEIIDGRWCAPAELSAWLLREPEHFTATFRRIWSRLHSG